MDRLKGLHSSTWPVHEPYSQVHKRPILYICWILSCIIRTFLTIFHNFIVMPKIRTMLDYSFQLEVLKNWILVEILLFCWIFNHLIEYSRESTLSNDMLEKLNKTSHLVETFFSSWKWKYSIYHKYYSESSIF